MDLKCIDFNKVMHKQLIHSLELDKYIDIINLLHQVDISEDINGFQKKFNGFYGIRRNEKWRECYYEYFESIKNYGKDDISFRVVMENVSQICYSKNQFEPSFSSKLYATLFPEEPIWDKYVIYNLGLVTEWEKNKSFEKADEIYNRIKELYQSPEALKLVEMWNDLFSDEEMYKNISDTKKLDYILWSMR